MSGSDTSASDQACVRAHAKVDLSVVIGNLQQGVHLQYVAPPVRGCELRPVRLRSGEEPQACVSSGGWNSKRTVSRPWGAAKPDSQPATVGHRQNRPGLKSFDRRTQP